MNTNSKNFCQPVMLVLLLTLLFSKLAIADNAEDQLNWAALGYIVVTTAEDQYVSRHVHRDEAVQSAYYHAFSHGNSGELAYHLKHPQVRIDVVIPEVQISAPPVPPAPPKDTLEQLDEKTVYFCPADSSGALGTTQEPPGSNSNDGSSPWDAYATLDRLGNRNPGTDVRLCEGGVFNDQTLDIVHSGDIGEENAILLSQVQGQQLNSEQLMKLGYNYDLIDPVVVGCYKILNGVPRPCMDTYPRCNTGIETACYSKKLNKVLPYSPAS